MKNYHRIGAVFFALWGLLHVFGGGAILAAVTDSPDAGYAFYDPNATSYSALSGAVLGYLAFGFAWIGAAVTWVALRYNWRNSEQGLALNTALVGLTDLGLVIFLVLPGYVSWVDASVGLTLFAGGVIFGGIGCQASAPAGTPEVS